METQIRKRGFRLRRSTFSESPHPRKIQIVDNIAYPSKSQNESQGLLARATVMCKQICNGTNQIAQHQRNRPQDKELTTTTTTTSFHRGSSHTRSKCHRMWYRIVFIVLVALTCWTVATILQDYLRFPTSTTLYVEETSLAFPTVTMCSTRFLKKDVVCNPSPESRLIFGSVCENSSTFGTQFLRTRALHKKVWLNAMISMNDVLAQCSIRRQPCVSGDMRPTENFITIYGVCFRFFGNKYRFQTTPSPSDGLMIRLRMKPSELLGFGEKEVGFVVLLQEQGITPDITKHGVFIPLTETTLISVETDYLKLMGPPYPQACENDWPRALTSSYPVDVSRKIKYSSALCTKICYNRAIIKSCQCNESLTMSFMDEIDTAVVCEENDDDRACKERLLRLERNHQSPLQECECRPRCETFTYRPTYSRSTWTSAVRRRSRPSRSPYRQSALYIYLGSIILNGLKESPRMIGQMVTSDIAGYLSMFIGYSALALLESLEHICKFNGQQRHATNQ